MRHELFISLHTTGVVPHRPLLVRPCTWGGERGPWLLPGTDCVSVCLRDPPPPPLVPDHSREEPHQEEVGTLQLTPQQCHRHREHPGGAGEEVGEGSSGSVASGFCWNEKDNAGSLGCQTCLYVTMVYMTSIRHPLPT